MAGTFADLPAWLCDHTDLVLGELLVNGPAEFGRHTGEVEAAGLGGSVGEASPYVEQVHLRKSECGSHIKHLACVLEGLDLGAAVHPSGPAVEGDTLEVHAESA